MLNKKMHSNACSNKAKKLFNFQLFVLDDLIKRILSIKKNLKCLYNIIFLAGLDKTLIQMIRFSECLGKIHVSPTISFVGFNYYLPQEKMVTACILAAFPVSR